MLYHKNNTSSQGSFPASISDTTWVVWPTLWCRDTDHVLGYILWAFIGIRGGIWPTFLCTMARRHMHELDCRCGRHISEKVIVFSEIVPLLIFSIILKVCFCLIRQDMLCRKSGTCVHRAASSLFSKIGLIENDKTRSRDCPYSCYFWKSSWTITPNYTQISEIVQLNYHKSNNLIVERMVDQWPQSSVEGRRAVRGAGRNLVYCCDFAMIAVSAWRGSIGRHPWLANCW